MKEQHKITQIGPLDMSTVIIKAPTVKCEKWMIKHHYKIKVMWIKITLPTIDKTFIIVYPKKYDIKEENYLG